MENLESQVIKKCQAGELKQFGQLYDSYIKKIYNFVYYKTWHRQTAEDLTSQTFFKALTKIKQFDEIKGSFSSWLYKIARNTVIDYYRQNKADLNIDDIWGLADSQDFASEIDNQQKLGDVQKYLQNLKPDQKEIVIMKLWDGLTYQEIAEITGKTVAACKMTFSRTMARLRENLALILFYFILITKQILWLIK